MVSVCVWKLEVARHNESRSSHGEVKTATITTLCECMNALCRQGVLFWPMWASSVLCEKCGAAVLLP